MSNLRDEIGRLAHTMDEEDNAASDLWTWLPSYREAEKHHGDYWQEQKPSNADIMNEAAMYLMGLKPTPEQIAQAAADASEPGQWFACPCGEDHAAHDG